MPALIDPKPTLETWTAPQETKESLDWAPLAVIDLSTFDAPDGKAALSKSLKDALKNWGFWVVTGTGIPQEQIDRQLSIAKTFFKLPLEEKRKVPCDFAVGNYFGYREPTRTIGKTQVKENMELLGLPKFTTDYDSMSRHEFINKFRDEIAPFQRLIWDNVIRKLFVLFAIVLELPEDYFVKRHDYDSPSEDHLRYMIYHPRPAEEDKEISDQWIVGHTDFGSLTLLFSQSVAALQIRTPDNEWKWVKPVEGGITCNAADTLSFMTKGYIKSAIHRVIRPPADQAHLDRIGLFYFVRPGDSVPIVPAPSPVLRREGFLTEKDEAISEADAVKGYEYVRARVKNVHDRKATRIAVNNEETMFKVKNLAVQDLYL